MKKVSMAIVVIVSIPFIVFSAPRESSQNNNQPDAALKLTVSPNAQIPLPSAKAYFTTGAGGDISVDLPILPIASLRGGIGYSYLPIWSGGFANMMTGNIGGVLTGPTIGGVLTTEAFVTGGVYYGLLPDQGSGGANACFDGGLRIGWKLSTSTDIGLELRYDAALDGLGGLLRHDLGIALSTRYSFLRRRDIKIENINILNIYPVLYKRYIDHEFGSLLILNDSGKPVEELRVSISVDQYMDAPWECAASSRLDSGQELKVPIVALFNERKVLDITESTIVSALISVSYSQDGRPYKVEKSAQLRIQDRNAITWDDDRKPAAYVTYKDPAIIDLASTITRVSVTRDDVGDANFRTAIALHESLRGYGIVYRVDPTTPFSSTSAKRDAIDYLQFPRNTLQIKAGDCDDLSILYSSILQASGIDTAFITIPGHIYIAFALKSTPREAASLFSDSGNLIIKGDRAWVPLEVTMLGSPFLDAWQTGAKEWKSAIANDTARFYPLAEAWEEYEPVGQVGEFDSGRFIAYDRISSVFSKEFDRFVQREIYAQTSTLQAQGQTKQDNPKTLNGMGTIYAKYGDRQKARAYFEKAIKGQRYAPAVINLGTIEMLDGNLKQAASLYAEALGKNPANASLLLQLVRISNLQGDYQASTSYYQRLKELDADLARRHADLDVGASGPSRSSSRSDKAGEQTWAD